jgi:hypothetical protein
MTRPTLGKISTDLLLSSPSSTDPIEIQRATEQEYLDNLIWAVKHAQKKIDCSNIEGHDQCKDRFPFDGDFYIVALLKKEKLLPNVLRNYFVPTLMCPTPAFDQTVYKYDHQKKDIEFMWVVPDRDTCETFKENILQIVPEERGLLDFVIKYYDGTLFYWAKKLNGETDKPGNLLEEK